MNILLTNQMLLSNTGSEIATYTTASGLNKLGHNVTIYAPFINWRWTNDLFKDKSIAITDSLESINYQHFDIAHIHHNTTAIETRHHFPSIPIVFESLGIIPFLEQPPAIDLNISHFIAISEEIKQNLITKGIDNNKITLIGNIVDSHVFHPQKPINHKPQKALILSNKIDEEHKTLIKAACKDLNIRCKFIGKFSKQCPQECLPNIINDSDIVFSLGRGIIEAMLCGRIPIVLDKNGADGLVTPDNVKELMMCNFSGRYHNHQFTKDSLISEISQYNASNSLDLYNFAKEHFDSNIVTQQLDNLYRQIINSSNNSLNLNFYNIDAYYSTIQETKIYAAAAANRKITDILRSMITQGLRKTTSILAQ